MDLHYLFYNSICNPDLGSRKNSLKSIPYPYTGSDYRQYNNEISVGTNKSVLLFPIMDLVLFYTPYCLLLLLIGWCTPKHQQYSVVIVGVVGSYLNHIAHYSSLDTGNYIVVYSEGRFQDLKVFD